MNMDRILDEVEAAAVAKVVKVTKEVLGGLKPDDRILVIGLGLVVLSVFRTWQEENKKNGGNSTRRRTRRAQPSQNFQTSASCKKQMPFNLYVKSCRRTWAPRLFGCIIR